MTSQMASPIPQSVVPSVAFEIPLEKKSNSVDSPRIQKRLEELAHSPRKQVSLDDITKRISEASRRREDMAKDTKTKTSNYNAAVKKVYEKAVERNEAQAESLEKKLNDKLTNADAKRTERRSWVQKLSETTRNKLARGKKSMTAAEKAARTLEAKIQTKDAYAELRREELTNKKVEVLATVTESKVRRGQIALSIAEIESRQLETKIEEKINSASHRRELNQMLNSARLSEAAAMKKERAAELQKKEDLEAKKSA